MDKNITLVSCIFVILTCLFFIIKITKELNNGKRKIQDGLCKLTKYNHWFIRIFAEKKIDDGWKKIFDGEKQISFWRKMRIALIFFSIGFSIFLISIILHKAFYVKI